MCWLTGVRVKMQKRGKPPLWGDAEDVPGEPGRAKSQSQQCEGLSVFPGDAWN